MNNLNPYATSEVQGQLNTASMVRRSTFRWVLTGFIVAATVPVILGAYGLYRESVYVASLPPGVGACGMGAFGSLVIMIFGGPFCGMIGGLVGWIACKVS